MEPIYLKDNCKKPIILDSNVREDLMKIANIKISDLCGENNNPGLLVFPRDLDQYNDDIGKSPILSYSNGNIETGNIMGFIGIGETRIKIGSRFDNDKNDYFMHYLLEKIFSVNMFDMKYGSDQESIFDFLVFLFPYFLKTALQQGLFKAYQGREYNDSNIRGVIDINRHIQKNIPFTGKIAYHTREQSFDNEVTQIIRHTIEYISHLPFGHNILTSDAEMIEGVERIIQATPSYSKHERDRLIAKSLRPKTHPYYFEYAPLQKLCVQILLGEEVKYGSDENEIYGVLFDGAWLWEEYLDRVISEQLGLTHCKNHDKGNSYKISMFTDGTAPRYPDFISDKMILDAKYKKYGEKDLNNVQPKDIAQVTSYMYVEQCLHGGFINPYEGETVLHQENTLRGYGGKLHLFNFPIKVQETYSEFTQAMVAKEQKLIEEIRKLIQ